MEGETVKEEKIDFNSVREHLVEYINVRIKMLKVTVIEYVAKLMPVFVFVAIMALVLLVFWIFGNVAAALAIGKAIGNTAAGFLIISVFNLVLAGILILTYRGLIYKPVSNWIIKVLSQSLESDEIK